MSSPSDDLQAILREQAELRIRLVALDRKIEAWQDAQSKKVVSQPLSPVDAPPVKPAAVQEKLLPPPLPPSTATQDQEDLWVGRPAPSVADAVSLPIQTPAFRKLESDVSPTHLPKTSSSTPPPAPPEQKSSLEFKLGTVWLVRIGIVILITGLVLLGNYAYHRIVAYIGPWGKLTALALAGGILAVLGSRLEKQSENLLNYGRVLLAGGIAVFYYTVYAAGFVSRLRVIESPLLGGVLLLAVGAAIVWLAEKRHSQTVAFTAILLSYYTSAINPLGSFSLYSNLLLTAGAVFFLLRHRWIALSFFSLVGTYGSFIFWRYHRTGHFLTGGTIAAADFWTGALFLAGYWILFTVAVFFSRAENFSSEKRTPFLSLNNGAFFGLIALSLHRWQPDFVGRFYLGFAVILLVLSWVAKRRQSEDLFLDGAYLIQGLAVLTLGLVAEFSGYQLATALAIQSTLLLLGLNRRHGWIYEMGAALASLGALGIVEVQNPAGRAGTIVRCALISLFILNSWICRHRKKPFLNRDFSWPSFGYSLLTFPLITALLGKIFSDYPAQATFCFAGFAVLAIGLLIRLPELGLVGQLFMVLSSVNYCATGLAGPESWLVVATICLSPLLMIHWWQRQENKFRVFGEALFSILTLGVIARFIHDSHPGNSLVIWTALAAAAILIYGICTRAFVLALGGQIFVFATAAIYFWRTLVDTIPWPMPSCALAILIVHQILLDRNADRFPVSWRESIRQLPQVFFPLLFAVIGAWGWAYIHLPGRMLFYVLFAASLVTLAHFQKTRDPVRTSQLMLYAGLSIIWALIIYALHSVRYPSSYSQTHQLDILSFLLLAVLHYLTKRSFLKTPYFPKSAQIGLLVSIMIGFWMETSHAIAGTQFPKTVAWALLATILLGIGLAIRERGYRLGGLLLLALSILRIATVDVWKLDRLYQILSFLVLGILLLGIGFIYNKFADKLREWL